MSDEPDDEKADESHDESNGVEEPRATTGEAKAELFEAIDHFKNAASILFERASTDPAVRTATKEAGQAMRTATKEAERVVKQLGDAAEPLAKQLTSELGRLTRDVMRVVDKKPSSPPPSEEAASDEEGSDEEE